MLLLLLAALTLHPAPTEAQTALYHHHHLSMESELNGDRAECRKSQGRYEEGICYLPALDSIKLVESKGGLQVEVQTNSTDGDGCLVTGPGQRLKNGKILVRDEGGQCQVEVSLHGANSAEVHAHGENSCEDVCGMHATVDIDHAHRVK